MSIATTFGQPLKDTVSDIDGNVYHTVKIGAYVWMVENLKVTHYRNGDVIPNVKNDSLWSYLKTGAYCNYNNDTNIAKTYGRLYNWYAVNDRKNIAPKGWHIATTEEWKMLTKLIYDKLKENDKAWNVMSPYTGLANSLGFNVQFGGRRTGHQHGTGDFSDIKREGIWWEHSVIDTSNGNGILLLTWNMYNNSDEVIAYIGNDEEDGFSVRCVKDYKKD